MSAEEMSYWVAYLNLQNEEYRNKIVTKVNQEHQESLTVEEHSKQMRTFLNSLGRK